MDAHKYAQRERERETQVDCILTHAPDRNDKNKRYIVHSSL